jgi:hypothetical protein
MFNLIKKMAYAITLMLPLLTFAADVAQPETGQKAKIEFVRSKGTMSVLSARVDVNGRRVGEVGKGESFNVLIDPGRTLVKVDSAYSPGQFLISFTTEKGAEYRLEINDSLDKMDVDHVFGVPPKVANGEVVESSGILKITMTRANLPKPVEPAPVVTPVVVAPVMDSIPASAVKATITVEDQLRTLKHLYEQELISKEVYAERQQKILDGMK